MKKAFLMILLSMNFTFAEKVNVQKICPDLKTCVKKVSDLTGQGYMIATELKDRDKPLFVNFEVEKEELGKVLSWILNQKGYTRISYDKDQYKIISTRDVRYNATPRLEASFTKAPSFPNNSDYYTMSYQLKGKGTARVITRALRPFISRYGRIIEMSLSNQLVIQDTGENLERIYHIVKGSDIVLSKKELKDLEKKRRERQKIRLLESRRSLRKKSGE